MNRDDWELRDRAHEMWAEGCQETEPQIHEINKAVNDCGYYTENIDIHYDELQGLWRWFCYIK